MRLKKSVIILFILFAQCCLIAEEPNLLIQIHTRGNVKQFFQTLDGYYKHLSGEVNTSFLILCDEEDSQMNQAEIKNRLQGYQNLILKFKKNQPAVGIAVGIDTEEVDPFKEWFTLLIVANDHDIPTVKGFDKKIVEAMNVHFPQKDGVLNFSEESPEDIQKINRTPIIGKNYYSSFANLFYPHYKTPSVALQEFTFISRILGKEYISDQKLFERRSVATQIRSAELAADQQIYQERAANTFGIEEKTLRKIFPKEWSILICTLPERHNSFERIYNKLLGQIKENGLEDKVEVLYFIDNRENTVGKKRNELLRRSQGLYTNYIDDDDEVHDNYIKLIYEQLATSPDCVNLIGIITFDGKYPRTFIHSVDYNHYFERNEVYYRPPNHLNTMKRSIASRFLFPNISYSEDTDWAMQVARSGLLKTEAKVKEPFYFYLYVTNKNR